MMSLNFMAINFRNKFVSERLLNRFNGSPKAPELESILCLINHNLLNLGIKALGAPPIIEISNSASYAICPINKSKDRSSTENKVC